MVELGGIYTSVGLQRGVAKASYIDCAAHAIDIISSLRNGKRSINSTLWIKSATLTSWLQADSHECPSSRYNSHEQYLSQTKVG